MRELDELRDQIDVVNLELLALLNRRAELVDAIQRVKCQHDLPIHQPEREEQILAALVAENRGPFPDATIRALFTQILHASVQLMESRKARRLRVSREAHPADLTFVVQGATMGETPILIAGPCAIEDWRQMEQVGRCLSGLGLRWLRGGAFKPRSSPYSFQGLGQEGLELLAETAKRHGLVSVTEVMDPRSVELVCRYADVLQIGARNMYNYDLLREVGRTRKPVLLKRGLSATIGELLSSAEYIVSEGNEQVILCERGIRTFERETRNTLDISAIPLLRQKSYLPVVVDISHAAGRKDILVPLGRAALAAGANGLMVEMHPNPAVARSDGEQQLDLDEFRSFAQAVGLPQGGTDLKTQRQVG